MIVTSPLISFHDLTDGFPELKAIPLNPNMHANNSINYF